MKKTDIENESERLKKVLNQLKNDNKKFKQQAKYAKDTKKNLKEEIKRLLHHHVIIQRITFLHIITV